MEAERLGFGARLWLALVLFWKVLLDGLLAARTRRLLEAPAEPARLEGGATPAAPEAPARPETVAEVAGPDLTPALQLLSILQREGRFIDFLQEDVAGFSDAEVGAAARVVHEGARRALKDYLVLAPVRAEQEGDAVVLEKGYDAARTRVTGHVVGEPPFHGKLAHHGWLVTEIKLPRLADGHDARVVAPAEVEL